MKKLLLNLSAAVIFTAGITANAQTPVQTTGTLLVLPHDSTTTAKKMELNPDYLPGNTYGIGISGNTALPDPKPPKNPNPPSNVTKRKDDISVNMSGHVHLTQQACNDYFTVRYKVTVNNLRGDGPILFKLNIAGSFSGQAINNSKDSMITLAVGQSVEMNDSFRINYPYTIINTRGGTIKQYISESYKLDVKTIGGFYFEGRTHYILEDPNLNNNHDETSFNSPMPPACLKTDNQHNTY